MFLSSMTILEIECFIILFNIQTLTGGKFIYQTLQDFIRKVVRSKDAHFWLGMTDKESPGNWSWVDGAKPGPTDTTAKYEPIYHVNEIKVYL